MLIVGGGIANFTDIAATFKGIVHALREYAPQLIAHKVKIWVRRGGPNYVEGLRQIAHGLGEWRVGQISLPDGFRLLPGQRVAHPLDGIDSVVCASAGDSAADLDHRAELVARERAALRFG